ncbi:hypothetical protein [Vibrio sp. RM-69-4]|uniref:hypothetical protein n=1 Tax=Vibrio sp. RM-69-4 TaxID=2950157 RepID=UPI00215C314D|nr:hypothetical protein [Vibrio sp. RM-69-4]MCR9422200.1 hypothetical protein [Vibrio sp. RM-69-4]
MLCYAQLVDMQHANNQQIVYHPPLTNSLITQGLFMAYNGIDTKSQSALQQLLNVADFEEGANGDVFLTDVHVQFKASKINIVALTDIHICRTTMEYGKIACEEAPADDFDSEHCHIEFDAGWDNVSYTFNNNSLTVSGNSNRFGKYTFILSV